MFLGWDFIKSVNEQTGTFAGKAAKVAGRQVCKWYRKYPSLWDINPGQGAFLAEVCPPLGEPPSGGYKNYLGGQCSLNYVVNWRYGNTSGVVPTLSAGTTITAITAAGPLGTINTSVSGNTGILSVVDKNGNLLTDSGPYGPQDRIRKIIIQPPSGTPDTCGNPPDIIPPADQPQDPLDFNFPVTFENNTNNNTTNYKTVNFNFDVPIKIEFPIRVKIGDIDFNLDVDGVDVNPTSPTNKDLGDEINEITDIVNNFKPCGGIEDLEDLEEEVTEEVEDKEEEDDKLKAVAVTVVEVPKKGKTIVLPNADDNTFFAGYFSWTLDGYRGVEMPIRKRKNIFVKPEWASGYRVYRVNLAVLSITTFKSS